MSLLSSLTPLPFPPFIQIFTFSFLLLCSFLLSFSFHIVLFWIFPFSVSLNCLYFLYSSYFSSIYLFIYLFLFNFLRFLHHILLILVPIRLLLLSPRTSFCSPIHTLCSTCPDEQSSVSPRIIRSQLVVSRRTHPIHLVTV